MLGVGSGIAGAAAHGLPGGAPRLGQLLVGGKIQDGDVRKQVAWRIGRSRSCSHPPSRCVLLRGSLAKGCPWLP
eukprot:4754791-Pyramimonas_sp.AAC.1